MKKIFLYTMLFFSINLSYAQEWFPDEATWNYYYYNEDTRVGRFILSVVGEEEVGGVLCKKLHLGLRIANETLPPPPDYWIEEIGYRYVYVENDGNKVNIYRDGEFYTLYDFDAEINDVWTTVNCNYAVDCFTDNTGEVRVTGKGIENVNGTDLEYLDVETLAGSEALLFGRIYKYLGSSNMCFFPEYNYGTEQCAFMPSDALMSQGLACFSSDDLSYGSGDCEFILGTETQDFNEISLYQKYDRLIIENINQNIEKVTIYSINGKEVISVKNRNTVSLLGLAQGVYFVKVFTDKAVFSKKILIRN